MVLVMPNATPKATANMMAYWTGWAMQSRMPKMPVTPVPEAARLKM